MGHLNRTMTTQYIFPFLCFILAPVLAGNPCQGITLGGCDVPDDSRVGAHPYGLDVCQKLCQLDDDCLFWRHDNTTAGTKEECLFINTDYHQDCKTLAGPVSINLEDCVNVDQTSCDSVIPEICNYSGNRLTDFEFGPGETSSIQECQQVASALEAYHQKPSPYHHHHHHTHHHHKTPP